MAKENKGKAVNRTAKINDSLSKLVDKMDPEGVETIFGVFEQHRKGTGNGDRKKLQKSLKKGVDK